MDISTLATKEDIKMILELLKEFKYDVYKRFEQVDKRFEQIDKRFEQVIELIKDERHEREKMEDKLEKVYESRHGVEYKITRDFILKNLAWNTLFILGAVGFIKIILL